MLDRSKTAPSPNPQTLIPPPLYACLYRSPAADPPVSTTVLVGIAQAFSPRYERHRDDLVSIDISGLERLLGTPRTIAEELDRDARAHGVRVHVAVARTRMAALVLAQARPGLTIVDPGQEAAALASIRIEQLGTVIPTPESRVVVVLRSWGLRTLGDLAALPSAELAARLGQRGVLWQAIARGEDIAAAGS